VADSSGMHLRLKQPRPLPVLRILAFAPGSRREQWILNDLAKVDALVQVAHSAQHVIAALTEDPLPAPAMLVVDFDHMSAVEVLMLHTVRERGWCGEIVAVGLIPKPLRSSLGIERMISATAPAGALATVINNVGFDAQTLRIPLGNLSARGG
jgi:hypothetical protein